MSEELALGQRTGVMIASQGGFNEEELKLLFTNGITTSEVQDMFAKFPDQTLNDAIGDIVMLRNGQGQERNEPFQTQAQADAQVSAEVAAQPHVTEEHANLEVAEQVAKEGLTP